MNRVLALCLVIAACCTVRADDWPMFGRDRTHNAVSPEKGAPTDWQYERRDHSTGAITTRARNIAWAADLGSDSLGGPVVANGLVWVGTNNARPRDPKHVDPKRVDPKTGKPRPLNMAVLMCFRERDGTFLWQYASPRLRRYHQDLPTESMGTPLVEGDRLYLITNRCEALCFDIGPLKRGTGTPTEVWKVDMIRDFGVFPCGSLCRPGFVPSPAADADRLFVVTSNGVDEDHVRVAAPRAPSLICFDKKTGKALWTDNSPGKDIMRSQKSSPLVVEVKGRTQVVVGQGDGWLRAFDAASGKLVWKCDLNPKGAKYRLGGKCDRNYIMATPVYHDGRIYIATGQDAVHYSGTGHLSCIDPTKAGDVSLELEDGGGKGKPNPNSAVVWRYGGPAPENDTGRDYLFCRTLGNCTVHDGLVYVGDYDGYAYCLDAKTGELYRRHNLKAPTWGTPLWVDGKVYFATEEGDVFVFAHGKEMKQLAKIYGDEVLLGSPVFANGTLFLAGDRRLFAIRRGGP